MSEAVKKKRFFKENGITRIIVAVSTFLFAVYGESYEKALIILAIGIWLEAISITDILRAREGVIEE